MSYWGLRKPPLGTPIDPGHPLAQGLIGRFACDELGGTLARDSAGGGDLTLGGGAAWSRDGLVLTAGGASATVAVAPARFQIQPPITIVWEGVFSALPGAGGSVLFGLPYNTGITTPFSCYYLWADSSGSNITGHFSWNNGAGTQRSIATGTFLRGVRVQIVGTLAYFGAGRLAGQVYLSSGWTASFTETSGGSISYAGTPPLWLGDTRGAVNPSSTTSFGLIYNRALDRGDGANTSRDAIGQLWLDPYGMCKGPAFQVSFAAALPVIAAADNAPLLMGF